jgi:hypothetical protein
VLRTGGPGEYRFRERDPERDVDVHDWKLFKDSLRSPREVCGLP